MLRTFSKCVINRLYGEDITSWSPSDVLDTWGGSAFLKILFWLTVLCVGYIFVGYVVGYISKSVVGYIFVVIVATNIFFDGEKTARIR